MRAEKFDIELAKRLYKRASMTPEEAEALFTWGYLNDCLQRRLESNEFYLERLRRTKALRIRK